MSLRFVEGGWSLKKMHRLIMLSQTYQMSSEHSPQAVAADPENRLYWRMPMRRLEAEEIRDAILAGSGLLNKVPAQSMLHVGNREFLFDHTSKDGTKYDSKRRTIYLPVIRNNLYDVFTLFDSPDAAVSTGDRSTTTVATQALFWMNSPLVLEAAAKMTEPRSSAEDVSAPLRRLYLTAYGREPTESEAGRMRRSLTETETTLRATEADETKRIAKAWALIGQVILSGNEFVWVK